MNNIQVQKEKEIRSSLAHVLHKTYNLAFSPRSRAVTAKKYTNIHEQSCCLPIRRTMQHRLTTTTSLLRPCSFDQNVKIRSRLIILKTPLIRTPHCYDQEFMDQWWSHQRGSAALLFERSRCRGRGRRCRGILNSLITRGSRAVHIPVFHRKCGFSDRSLTD